MSFLVLNFQGKKSNALINMLAKGILDSRCNIVTSYVTVMGGELVGMMLLSGQWDAIVKMEATISRLEQELEIKIISNRTGFGTINSNLIPYVIDVVSIDRAGILSEIIDFIIRNNFIIQEMNTVNFDAPHTAMKMVSLHIVINIPSDTSIAAIRSDFIDFCDSLNVDAVMEPMK